MKYMFSKLALAVSVALCGACFSNASIAQTAEFNLDEPPVMGEMQPVAFMPSEEEFIGAPVLPGGVVTVSTDEDVAVGGGSSPHHGWHGHSLLDSLTDDQLEKMHALHNQFLDEAGPKHLELASKERKLKDVMLANSVDTTQARALQADINRLRGELGNLKLDNHIAMAGILTTEQKTEIRQHVYRACLAARAHHHFAMMGHHHVGPPGGPPHKD